jgi:pimeloyl-ACP methyl ester carboxylesterase
MHQLLYKAAAAAAQGMPLGEHKVFEGLAHLGPLEDPARVADDALDFFARCQQGSAGKPAASKLISKL